MPRRTGIRKRLRDAYTCESCGAARGEHCRTYDGRKAGNVHESRWSQWADDSPAAEEKDMTEISDEEAREALWASSEAGRAAVAAADAKLHEVDPDGDWPMGIEYLAAITYAAHRAHEEVADLEAREAREHRHAGPISAVSHGTGTDGTPWTFSLRRCRECGGSFTQRLEGSWTWTDLERQP